jgi:hypothetical protein
LTDMNSTMLVNLTVRQIIELNATETCGRIFHTCLQNKTVPIQWRN